MNKLHETLFSIETSYQRLETPPAFNKAKFKDTKNQRKCVSLAFKFNTPNALARLYYERKRTTEIHSIVIHVYYNMEDL